MGIRVALGGRLRHVIVALFRGPMAQIVLGILIGLVIADRLSEGDMVRVIAVYGCAVVAISALATLGPTCQVLLARRTANLLYSPTIDALQHDGIAIEQHVERENPHGLRGRPDSQPEQRDEEDQYERRAVAYLGALRRELGAIQKFLAVFWLWGRLKAVQ